METDNANSSSCCYKVSKHKANSDEKDTITVVKKMLIVIMIIILIILQYFMLKKEKEVTEKLEIPSVEKYFLFCIWSMLIWSL